MDVKTGKYYVVKDKTQSNQLSFPVVFIPNKYLKTWNQERFELTEIKFPNKAKSTEQKS